MIVILNDRLFVGSDVPPIYTPLCVPVPAEATYLPISASDKALVRGRPVTSPSLVVERWGPKPAGRSLHNSAQNRIQWLSVCLTAKKVLRGRVELASRESRVLFQDGRKVKVQPWFTDLQSETVLVVISAFFIRN